MAKSNLVTSEIYSKILIDYNSNKYTINQLSKKYKLSGVTINKHLKKNGNLLNKDIKFPEEIKQKIINDYINQIPPFILIKKYNISRTRLKEITKQYRKFRVKDTAFRKLWKENLTDKEYIQKTKEVSDKISKAAKGSNNPMYGRPSPRGAGNGWKGWYKGIFFRSLREFSFMINYIERFKLVKENAEKVKFEIKYKDYAGQERNYYPDYLINDKFIVEIKPKRLWNTPLIIAKKEAAERFCKEKGYKYKLIDPKIVDLEIIKSKVDNEQIKFSGKYKERFEEYYKKNSKS